MWVVPDDMSVASDSLRSIHSYICTIPSRVCCVPDDVSVVLDHICDTSDDIRAILDAIGFVSMERRFHLNDVRHAPDDIGLAVDGFSLVIRRIHVALDAIRADFGHSRAVFDIVNVATGARRIAKTHRRVVADGIHPDKSAVRTEITTITLAKGGAVFNRAAEGGEGMPAGRKGANFQCSNHPAAFALHTVSRFETLPLQAHRPRQFYFPFLGFKVTRKRKSSVSSLLSPERKTPMRCRRPLSVEMAVETLFV